MVSFANVVDAKEEKIVEGSHDALLEEEEETAVVGIAEIVYSHFDSYQRDALRPSASRAASALRSELSSAINAHNAATANATHNDDDDDEVEEEENQSPAEIASAAVLRCIDAAFSVMVAHSSSSSSSSSTTIKRDRWGESVSSTLELAAAYACLVSRSDNGGGKLAHAALSRAAEFGNAGNAEVRSEACRLAGCLTEGLMGLGRPKASILKNKRKKDRKSSRKGSNNGRNDEAAAAAGEEVANSATTLRAAAPPAEGWRTECLLAAAIALLPRITDRIAKVRSAALSACAPLLSYNCGSSDSEEEEKEGSDLNRAVSSLRSSLLWLLANDSSAANRATVARILPAASPSQCKEEEEHGGDDNVAAIIERIGDVDAKVREAALDNLRENARLEEHLDEDRRVEILRMGLTRRCPTTYAKTVELLCCNWLKSCKFDPIALLDRLNPVLNESICEQAAQILLRVASAIDCESPSEKGVQLVRKHFGAPEIRTMQQQVLAKRSIVDAAPQVKGEDVEEERAEPPSLSPSLALFLRVKIDSAKFNKPDLISEIVTDIPTLCNLLNSHIDGLISFHESDEYEDMDEDDVAAHEDDKNFLSLQLIHMAKSSEVLSEEGSRRHFLSIMRRILARLATPDDLVEACVGATAAAHDSEAQFLQTVSEILADVEEDDTFRSDVHDEKAIVIVRQMRIIAILSIVLESISARMVDHPILEGFFQHLSPAITSKNAIVREHGVICLSKFCLLSSAEKVTEEFEPLLMTIAGRVEERVEVRAQAVLALCDLALVHDGMLSASAEVGEDGEPNSAPFKDMLLEMLDHAKPGIVVIAAEIAAKLLLAGRLRDPTLVAHLLLVYFDTTLTAAVLDDLEEEDDIYGDGAEAAKRVGSPVRLQQLLSIFFPTYAMSSLDANDDMIASLGPLLSIVNRKLSGLRNRQAMGKAMMAEKLPIAKMVEYVCYTVDLADKKKDEESKAKPENKGAEATDDDGANQATEEARGNVALVEEDDLVEASSTLLASIEIARFLSDEGDGDAAPTFYARTLAKILGGASIDVDAEDGSLLRTLKSLVGEAEYAHGDGPTVKSIKKLANLLVDVEDQSDEETVVAADEKEEVEEDDPFDFDTNDSSGKENPSRGSVGSDKSSTKQRHGAEEDIRRTSGSRLSLADVICN